MKRFKHRGHIVEIVELFSLKGREHYGDYRKHICAFYIDGEYAGESPGAFSSRRPGEMIIDSREGYDFTFTYRGHQVHIRPDYSIRDRHDEIEPGYERSDFAIDGRGRGSEPTRADAQQAAKELVDIALKAMAADSIELNRFSYQKGQTKVVKILRKETDANSGECFEVERIYHNGKLVEEWSGSWEQSFYYLEQ